MTLAIPQKKDPFARALLLAMAGGVVWCLFATVNSANVQPAEAQAQIIIEATPTLGIQPPQQDTPAFAAAIPTPTAQPLAQVEQGGGWLDQQLTAAAGAADQFANDQAAALAAEQQAAAEKAAAEHAQYLANVGAQAPHCPRCDVDQPPPSQSGPILVTPPDGSPPYVIAPAAGSDQPAPAAPAIAAAVPPISDQQRAVLADRDSNGCAPGQVFYPRSGCHTPGSAGPMPGPVGAP